MLARSAFVGRDSELALVGESLEAVSAGQPRVIWCEGEAGIGKTRLAEEAMSRAASRGLLCAWGVADESSGTPPYWPWRQILRQLAASTDLDAIADGLGARADLARLAPDLFAVGGETEPGLPRAFEQDRFRQLDAVSRLLRQVSLEQPLAVVLDDAHWSDEASLLLLGHVVISLTGERLLLWVNSRDSDRRHGPLPDRLTRTPAARQITLAGLTEHAVGEQLASMIGRAVGPADVSQARAVTGGNPFLVGEVARALLDPASAPARDLVTRGTLDAVSSRLARLSEPAAHAARAASIAGREFAVSTVAAILGVPTMDCLRWLDETARAGLIEPAGQPGGYRFVHALIRDAIEAALAPTEQVRLHAQAARAIEARYPNPPDAVVYEIARHWARAAVDGAAATASGWLERAGAAAMSQLAYEDAAGLFREALRAGAGEISDEDRWRLLLASGRAMSRYGALGDRLDACLEAASLARRSGRLDIVAEAALVMEPVGVPGFDLATRRLCQEAMAGLGAEFVALRARVTARFAETFIFLPDPDAARSASEQALAAAERCRDPQALAAALRARQVVLAGPDSLADRELLAKRMLELSLECADPGIELQARLCQVDVAFERGDLARVAAEIEAATRCAPQVGGPVAQFLVIQTRSVLAQAQGRAADCRRLAEEALALIGPTEHPGRIYSRAAVLGTLGRHAGQDDASLSAHGLLGGPITQPADPVNDPGLIAALAKADVLLTAGRVADAAAVYRTLGSVAGWRPPPHVVLLVAAFGIEVATALGDLDDVATLHGRLSGYRDHHVTCALGAAAYLGPAQLWLGRAARHLGRLDEALADLEEAERRCAASGAAGFRAEASYERAAALVARGGPGDRSQCLALLASAAAQARNLELTALASRIASLSATLEDAGPTLTRRELEVAELVANGLTNREIAVRLHLSERTAQNHVQHILTKLGLPNRGQVAVWVERSRAKDEQAG